MVILVADRLEEKALADLRAAGCDVVFDPALAGETLREAIVKTRCRVLIVRSTKVTADMLGAGDCLSVVIRAGAGVNTIDIPAASRRSILIANCPGKNAVAVAELTFALILALDRRVVENMRDLQRGVWNKKEYAQAAGLKGRTLGIVGMGQIGQTVARRALAFEMNVVAWSRSLTPERAEELGVLHANDPAEVAAQCDILTIHLAAAPQTKGIISAEVLDGLRPGSFVINTARADVLDYQALRRAVETRNLRVGLDVFPDEPSAGEGEFSDPIIKANGVICGTHHIGASTLQAQQAIADEAVAIAGEYVRSGRVRNCVNLSAESKAVCMLVVRHFNRPGVLAHTLNAISVAGVNVAEMENVICEGMEAACAQIKLDAPLDEDVLAAIKNGNEHVIAVSQGQSY